MGFQKKHELNVSTYQMCILDLYNEGTEYTLEDIMNATKIKKDDLKRHLISLTLPKFRILRKVPDSKGIKTTDVFKLNSDFKSKLYRVKIPLVTISKPSSSTSGARRHAIEAAIVRVMKTRKSLDHNTLVAEVSKQLSNKCSPSPQVIKKRIESLIEREYLERHH